MADALSQGNDMSATGNPKVSVCVLTYNHEQYVRHCLQSIVDQETDVTFEVIVADDNSTDGTRAIVQEFAARYPGVVKPVLRPVNIGGTRNFIETHNLANAIYVAHIDGDDLMLPGKLQRQVEFLDANPEFSVVWHKINLFDDKGGFVPGENYDLSFFPNGVVTLEHALRLGTVAAHSSVMYRRSKRKTTQTDFEVLDLFYAWEYLSSGKGKILDDVLGSYRVSAQSSIQVKSIVNIQRMVVHHARYYLNLMPEQRRNIFVLALIDFMVDAKNLRTTAWSFAKLAFESASLVSPLLILRTISEMRRIPPCSPAGSIHIARSRRD
jgi:glycosyltransferase involved in cell wall biosynthesis